MLENIKSNIDSETQLTIKSDKKDFYEFDDSDFWRKYRLGEK